MPPSDADVRRQLDRLLASAAFANAGRMSRFLKFVVEKKLAGEAERLKEYVIGVEVFDRGADYDPRVDSIVRVEAARLRAKLAEYYAGEGRRDALVLGLPKGGYAPVVTPTAAVPRAPTELPPVAPAAGTREPAIPRRGWVLAVVLAAVAAAVAGVVFEPWSAPGDAELRVAVMPFTPYAGDADAAALAAMLTEGVTAELVRAGRFALVASSAARAAYAPGVRPRELGALLDADVLIEARVTRDGERLHVEARAADSRLEQKLWVGGFAGTAADSDALEREIGAAIAAALLALELPD